MTKLLKLTESNVEFNIEDINLLTRELINLTAEEYITENNILVIVTRLMIAVANYVNLTGPEKKKLVIYVLRNFIKQDHDIYLDAKVEILLMFDCTIPTTIDLLIAASKSQFVFKTKTKTNIKTKTKKKLMAWCGC
jgi:hypothetical protein